MVTLKPNMYVRYKYHNEQKIGKVDFIIYNEFVDENFIGLTNNEGIFEGKILKASFNIIDLIEYMDLLEIENPIKLYGENKTIALFNPVRCDGFTEFEDGTHCIILNLDYLVDVKDLKIKSVLTKEQFNSMKYVVERDK